MVGERTAEELPRRHAQHRRQAPIGEVDQSVGGQGQGAFAHLLDQQPIIVLGVFEREDLLAALAGDQQGVDPPAADGVEDRLGLGEAGAQLLDLGGRIERGIGR
ncbi:MAG: hypothetical protein ACOCWF_02440 [Halochromatium sp.]